MGWKVGYGGKRKAHLTRFSASYITGGTVVDSNRVTIMREEKFNKLGHTASYREHSRSLGKINNDLSVSPYHDLPETLRPSLDKYHGMTDDQVPPIIAVLRRRKELREPQSIGVNDFRKTDPSSKDDKFFERKSLRDTGKLPDWHRYIAQYGKYSCIIVVFSGMRAYIFEYQEAFSILKISIEYNTDRARVLVSSEHKQKLIRWTEEVKCTEL